MLRGFCYCIFNFNFVLIRHTSIHNYMTFFYLPLILIFFLVGCAKEPPQCSDEKTLDVVRQILSEEMNLADPGLQEEVFKNLKFVSPKATDYDKKNKKFSCESTLTSGASYQVPIKYQSQLADDKEHLVAMTRVPYQEISKLKAALLTAMSQKSANNDNNVKNETQSQATSSEVITSILGVPNTNFDQLLDGVYKKYMRQKECWIASNENQQNYCMKIDSFDKVNVKGVNRFYAILSGVAVDEKGEENGSHATQGLLGAFVLEENAKQLNLIASDSKIAMGDWGTGPTKWKLVKIGPDDYYGWKNETGTMHQGYSNNFFHILAPYGAKVIDIADFISGVSDEGACSAEPCTTLESSFEFDTSKPTEKVFPLLVRVKGKDKGATLKDKNYNFYFDDKKWKYVEPNDYILKDKGF